MEFKYYSVKEILQFLEKEKLSINKKFGQNFLINAGVCDSIVKSLNITSNTTILEVGCGLGSLTHKLLQTDCHKFIGFEIDKAYCRHLHNLFDSNSRFSLVEGDFLKTFHHTIEKLPADSSIVVTGNLPYYITTPILELIFESQANIKHASFMMQKEVALRVVSSHGSKQYGSLTIFAHFFSNPKIVCKISPSSFYPPPNVDSAVVAFAIMPNKFLVRDRALFFKVARSLFINRRKQIKNNLQNSPFLKELNANDILEVLDLAHIPPTIRGEALAIDKIVTLANCVYDYLAARNSST